MSSEYDARLYSQACFNVCQVCGEDFVAPRNCEECLLDEDETFLSIDSIRDGEYQRLKKIFEMTPEKLEEILTHY